MPVPRHQKPKPKSKEQRCEEQKLLLDKIQRKLASKGIYSEHVKYLMHVANYGGGTKAFLREKAKRPKKLAKGAAKLLKKYREDHESLHKMLTPQARCECDLKKRSRKRTTAPKKYKKAISALSEKEIDLVQRLLSAHAETIYCLRKLKERWSIRETVSDSMISRLPTLSSPTTRPEVVAFLHEVGGLTHIDIAYLRLEDMYGRDGLPFSETSIASMKEAVSSAYKEHRKKLRLTHEKRTL